MTTYRIQRARGRIETTTNADRAEALSKAGHRVTAKVEA